MEKKIGETFELKGRKLQVKESDFNSCDNCFLRGFCSSFKSITGDCDADDRTDCKDVIFVEVQEQTEQQTEQPQELNLCEILKYCPQGETFWSPLFGYVKLHKINHEAKKVVVISNIKMPWDINNDGTMLIYGVVSSEIMLFPSKEQRDWTKVKYEKKKEKFDPKTLKPFDKVLSRYDGGCWSANLFSHIEEENNKYHGTCSFVCNGSLVKFCIPYNDDTKHLVGTKDEAPDFYKYWED